MKFLSFLFIWPCAKLKDNSTFHPLFVDTQCFDHLSADLKARDDRFDSDYERFLFNQKHTDICPLGAAALAGTTFPIDRKFSADQLGFSEIYAL